ncbi:MAG: class I SAM-dependent methyltransferase [bacterium]|nr:class I SAM-dependent methyltransferase [bacterium]
MTEIISKCIICESNEFLRDEAATFYLNLAAPLEVRCCIRCDFKWLNPQPSEAEYKELYQVGYLGANREQQAQGELLKQYPPKDEQYEEEVIPTRMKWYQSRLFRLRRIRPKSLALFDIGAGTGDFVALAKEFRWDASGMEVSKFACQRAKEKYRVDLINMDLDQLLTKHGRQYDVVHMSHVLEHISNPKEFLSKVKKLIAYDGLIVIEVPNQFRSWSDDLVNRKLSRQQIPRSTFSIHHPYFYGKTHLKYLLESQGYQVLSATTFFLERSLGSTSQIALGIVDFIGNLFGAHGRNIEVIATPRG